MARARAAVRGVVRHSRGESGPSKMARKRAAGRVPRRREPRGQKAKGEEKEAGESEAKLDLEGDAEEDPEAGPGAGAGAGRPAPWRWGAEAARRPSAPRSDVPGASGGAAAWVLPDVALPLSSPEE